MARHAKRLRVRDVCCRYKSPLQITLDSKEPALVGVYVSALLDCGIDKALAHKVLNIRVPQENIRAPARASRPIHDGGSGVAVPHHKLPVLEQLATRITKTHGTREAQDFKRSALVKTLTDALRLCTVNFASPPTAAQTVDLAALTSVLYPIAGEALRTALRMRDATSVATLLKVFRSWPSALHPGRCAAVQRVAWSKPGYLT